MIPSSVPKNLETAPLTMRVVALVLTFGLLAVVQTVVEPTMLLAERFLQGAGWVEALVLAFYAYWVVGRLYPTKQTAVWRRRFWTLFSVVFFAQLAIGLSGVERFLMTGDLHLPVPAMIVAGPLYRGEGLFMPILFAATVLFVGPAWCSYLCYVGSWDLNATQSRKRPLRLPKRNIWIRGGILLGIVTAAFLLRSMGVGGMPATLLGAGFGLVGVGVIVIVSRRLGTMAHCVSFCPIGLLADLLGKLSLFRLKITSGCTECGACSFRCRYDALRPENIKARQLGLSCTLCGDCLSSCKGEFIRYSLAGFSRQSARAVFLVVVVSLHAFFLGVARI